ncbi:MAG: AlkZ family DNA glycosylase [Chloroflexi bacterium]|nr:AlkZ family DNA glycosylase [Chloroflexota bacterium]
MSTLLAQRLHNHRLAGTDLRTPAEVVAWLGAVQAQDFAGAKWSLGLRLKNAREADIARDFDEGAILRTHVMRPTWHFVAPADIRWLIELTAPRVHTINGTMYRKLGLESALLARSLDIMARALEGGNYLTRGELAGALAQVGIPAEGIRLGYIVHYGELEAVLCSGPRRGKQFTYALLSERAPNAQSLPRDEALAELARRFFTSHGPAMIEDFAWWSGLTRADARQAVSMVRPALRHVEVDEREYWFALSDEAPLGEGPDAIILPFFDEYTIAYKEHSVFVAAELADQTSTMLLGGSVVLDGQVAGSWRRTLGRGAISIEIAPLRPFTDAEHAALEHAAVRFGEFHELPVSLRESAAARG